MSTGTGARRGRPPGSLTVNRQPSSDDLPQSSSLELVEWIGQLFKPPWWHKSAACRGGNSEPFFIERGSNASKAKRICADCPVSAACLDWALNQDENPQGIWAGTTMRERVALRRERRAAEATPLAV